VWTFILLARTPGWWPALRWVALIGSIVVAAILAVGAHRLRGRATAVVITGAMLFGILGAAAFSIDTVANSHSSGPMAVAGPSRVTQMVPPPGDEPGEPGAAAGSGGPGWHGAALDNPPLENLVTGVDNRWAAAAIGSMEASSLELKTGASIMAIGGFTGSDNSPTLDQFQGYVADHEVRYFISRDHNGPVRRESGNANAIAAWVTQNFRPIDVGGTTVYDLDAPIGK